MGFPVCKKENLAGLQAHRKREKSARGSPSPHNSLTNKERSVRFVAQPLSALLNILQYFCFIWLKGTISLFRAEVKGQPYYEGGNKSLAAESTL